MRSIFVINCIKDRNLRVSNGELLLEEIEDSAPNKTLTKMPFQKLLALFVVGHIHITTPLIEKCKKFGVALIVVKPNWRPVFYWSDSAEANYLLRIKQYKFDADDISLARNLIHNKISNQKILLVKTRRKDILTLNALDCCTKCLEIISTTTNYKELLGIEGLVAKQFFCAYFQDYNWKARLPRTKCDYINTILDIGYSILFNYVECFLRMFGFDLYRGIFHRQWFKRKSLVCDIMEPFRCIIDNATRTALNRNQFTEKDFNFSKGEFLLKHERSSYYTKVFFDELIYYKNNIFMYVRNYYRCFMRESVPENYPKFEI